MSRAAPGVTFSATLTGVDRAHRSTRPGRGWSLIGFDRCAETEEKRSPKLAEKISSQTALFFHERGVF
jgi:hypothetical protein